MLLNKDTITKNFTDIIEDLSYSKSKGTIFSDWLELTAIALRQVPFLAEKFPKDKAFRDFEDKYLKLAGHYSDKELNQFSQLLGLTTQGINSEGCDFLGDIFGILELSNSKNGQFFTPFPISLLMAQTTMAEASKVIEEKGIITISDSACGSGGTLIAAACELQSQSIDPRANAQFHAVDISRNCFNMTYIQLSLLNLQAVVQHGNTLSLEIWETRKTPQILFFEDWLKTAKANQKTTLMVEKMRQFLFQLEQPKQPKEEIKTSQSTESPESDFTFSPKQLSLFN